MNRTRLTNAQWHNIALYLKELAGDEKALPFTSTEMATNISKNWELSISPQTVRRIAKELGITLKAVRVAGYPAQVQEQLAAVEASLKALAACQDALAERQDAVGKRQDNLNERVKKLESAPPF